MYGSLKIVIPPTLYHATFKSNVTNILEIGLIPRFNIVWEESENGVYLANTPELAESFCEVADIVSEGEDNDIIILVIDSVSLAKESLKEDYMMKRNDGTIDCWVYFHTISPDAIEILSYYK